MASNKLAVLAACAIFVAPAAEARTANRIHHRRPIDLVGCPVHKNPFGELVDCRGWRFRDNAIGWDNSCFCLDYLPSQFACSSINRS